MESHYAALIGLKLCRPGSPPIHGDPPVSALGVRRWKTSPYLNEMFDS